MSNSSLVTYTKLSPNNSGKRTHSIDRITPHCFVGQVTAQSGCNARNFVNYNPNTGASCNYVVGYDGSVGLCVDESMRSWCSSSNSNDQRAVTIECASEIKYPYTFTDDCYNKLVELCVDICRRNGKLKLLWIDDKNKSLSYQPKSDEMIITVHRWFDNKKACPGDWLYNRLGELANTVTSKLGGYTPTPQPEPTPSPAFESYTVRINTKELNVRKGPGINYDVTTVVRLGEVYTIVDESNGWGKLKSGAGWINLSYTTKITISKPIPAPSPTPLKSSNEIAREVIAGKWGNGQDRKNRLTAAGYDYTVVQNKVNELLK